MYQTEQGCHYYLATGYLISPTTAVKMAIYSSSGNDQITTAMEGYFEYLTT